MQTPESPSARDTFAVRFDGKATDIALIFLRNIFLSLLTLGIYRFWGRAAMRRYLWGHMVVGEDRLMYTGTGLELLRGFAKFVVLALMYGGGLLLLQKVSPILVTLFNIGFFWGFAPFVTYSARRYRLTRTRLRNVAFSLRPKLGQYVLLSMVTTLLSIVSLGLLWPVASNDTYGFLMRQTTWGNKTFRYTGTGGDMWRLCLRHSPWVLLTLGVYTPWFVAAVRRYRGRNTFIDEAHFDISITGGQILGLAVTNALLVLCTLGLAMPVAIARSAALHARTTRIRGYIDLETVTRTVAEASAVLDVVDDSLGAGFEL